MELPEVFYKNLWTTSGLKGTILKALIYTHLAFIRPQSPIGLEFTDGFRSAGDGKIAKSTLLEIRGALTGKGCRIRVIICRYLKDTFKSVYANDLHMKLSG